ncbi:protein of unknown function [Lentzea xinjiangensis]|uniref:Uncharacterized protein n=1 Tax=Lentzea xinjiangensis TaxID=402600 RepID=A0A1H9MN99_9PSEU|nr:DUF4153 domain-containing protein [Lentzea xinjiangensis]SER25180.1 protein of unknown function [Lentzea xinjiangensis]
MTDSTDSTDSTGPAGASSPEGTPRSRYRHFRKVGYRPVAAGSPERSVAAEETSGASAEKAAEAGGDREGAEGARLADTPASRSTAAEAAEAAEAALPAGTTAPRQVTAGATEGPQHADTTAPQPTTAEPAEASRPAGSTAPRQATAGAAEAPRPAETTAPQPTTAEPAEAPRPAGSTAPQPTAAEPTGAPRPVGTPAPQHATPEPTGRPAEAPRPAGVATATLPPPSAWQSQPRHLAPPVVVPAPGVPLLPWWTPPAAGAPGKVLVAGLVAGLAGAFLAPPGNGVGWFLAGLAGVGGVLVATGRPTAERALWLAAALAFLAMGFLRAAEWIFPLCVLASIACGSIAVAGGKTVRGLLFGVVGVGLAGFRSIPWVAKGLARRGPIGVRPFASAGVALVLLVVFGSLLAGADQAFNDFLEGLVPDLEIGVYVRMGFYGVVAALGALGACYLVAAPATIDEDAEVKPGSLRLKDYGLPVGVLVLLFTGFVGTQLAVLFGGEAYVLRTAGVTFAEYARSGFWQLLWVTILTLGVIAGVARFAAKKTARDQLWLRLLLGALAVLTLVIVASALSRMWFYQQAYGWTVLRLLVASCEVWLAVVYLMVIASGITLRAKWLPKAIVGTGAAFFLAVVVLNPERVVADYNVSRFEATKKIDTAYLAQLSEDAVPALLRLPEPERSCALQWVRNRTFEQDWREFNLARHNARRSLEGVPVTGLTCESSYFGER